MTESTYKLNMPPENFIRVNFQQLEGFVKDVAMSAGLVESKANLLSKLLVENDLRGVFTHGTKQISKYATNMIKNELNTDPKISVIKETPVSLIMDGDGGLGYFPMYEGILRIIEKARSSGVAILQTRNHGHIGAAGIYSRLPLEYNLAAFVTAGGSLKLKPNDPVFTPAIGSPISISAPSGKEPPLVVDFSPVYDLRISPKWKELAEWIPGTIFRCIGLGMVAQIWGGLMAGSKVEEYPNLSKKYLGTGQCGFAFIFDVNLFVSIDEYKKNMDQLAVQLRELQPLEGMEKANYAGGIEKSREIESRRYGIPIGSKHQIELEKVAKRFNILIPWT